MLQQDNVRPFGVWRGAGNQIVVLPPSLQVHIGEIPSPVPLCEWDFSTSVLEEEGLALTIPIAVADTQKNAQVCLQSRSGRISHRIRRLESLSSFILRELICYK